MVEESHWRCQGRLQSLLISLKQVHHNAPNNHGHIAEVWLIREQVLLNKHLETAFGNSWNKVEGKLLIHCIFFAPYDSCTNNPCDESINIAALASQICQQTLDQLINEDKETKVPSVHPRKSSCLFQLLNCVSFTKKYLHDYWVGNSDTASIIKTLTSTSECRNDTVTLMQASLI